MLYYIMLCYIILHYCRFRQEDVYAHFAWSDADELTGLWCFGRRRVFKARRDTGLLAWRVFISSPSAKGGYKKGDPTQRTYKHHT